MSLFLVPKDSFHAFLLFGIVTFVTSMVVPSDMNLIGVDITIAYYPTNMFPPSPFQIFSLSTISPFYKFHICVKRYDMDDVRRLEIDLIVVAGRTDRVG
jgi:hypothetical protein